MNINIYVPSAIAIYSTGVITSAYFIEYVLGYKPCELCVLQRYPYFVIILSSILLMVHKNKLISVEISNFILAKSYIIIALASLTGLSIATYHYGIENSYWQNLTGCSDRLSNINLNTTDLLEGINTFEPNIAYIYKKSSRYY